MVRFPMNCNTSGIEKVMLKLHKKDPALFRAVQKKVNQIAELDRKAIDHFKNLRGPLKEYKRVHIGGFVLLFKAEGDIIIFDRLLPHGEAY